MLESLDLESVRNEKGKQIDGLLSLPPWPYLLGGTHTDESVTFSRTRLPLVS